MNFRMGPCRFLRPGGRVVRITRGLLILLSALAIFGTIAFIHRMETGSNNGDGKSLSSSNHLVEIFFLSVTVESAVSK